MFAPTNSAFMNLPMKVAMRIMRVPMMMIVVFQKAGWWLSKGIKVFPFLMILEAMIIWAVLRSWRSWSQIQGSSRSWSSTTSSTGSYIFFCYKLNFPVFFFFFCIFLNCLTISSTGSFSSVSCLFSHPAELLNSIYLVHICIHVNHHDHLDHDYHHQDDLQRWVAIPPKHCDGQWQQV